MKTPSMTSVVKICYENAYNSPSQTETRDVRRATKKNNSLVTRLSDFCTRVKFPTGEITFRTSNFARRNDERNVNSPDWSCHNTYIYKHLSFAYGLNNIITSHRVLLVYRSQTGKINFTRRPSLVARLCLTWSIEEPRM